MLPKAIYIFIGFILSCPFVFAQVNIERELISPFGSYSETPNLKISDSAGETLIASHVSGSFILTEGFQQALENEITGILDLSILVDYQVYPNPVVNQIFVEMTFPNYAEIALEVFDLKGRPLPQLTKQVKGVGKLRSSISFQELPTGIYVLMLTNKNRSLVASHKIQKLN